MEENEIYAFMFSFPQNKDDIAEGNFKKYILFNGKSHEIIQKLQKFMHEMKFTKLDDEFGWKKWVDPSGKISRKIFDKELKASL